MAKLIITLDGVVLKEYQLDGERVTIGRKPGNDILLDDQTVSSEHAAVQVGEAVTITDLDSTNGTLINNLPVRKQALRHGDVIRVGKHELKFVDEESQDLTATVVLKPASATASRARLNVLNGPRAGEIMALDKERSAIGKPGVEVAMVTREGDGYALVPVKTNGDTQLNGVSVAERPMPLHDGDLIEIAGTRLQFRFRG